MQTHSNSTTVPRSLELQNKTIESSKKKSKNKNYTHRNGVSQGFFGWLIVLVFQKSRLYVKGSFRIDETNRRISTVLHGFM